MSNAIRFCKTKETHSGENVFDVSRPNIFGNPFTHIKDKTTKALVVVENRDMAIDMYEEYFERMLIVNNKFREAWDKMYNAFCTYDTIYIGCYCNLSERCHGDIIIKKLRQRAIKQILENISQK